MDIDEYEDGHINDDELEIDNDQDEEGYAQDDLDLETED